MNERCETGCRRHAVTLWWNENRDDHTIELCGIDSDRLAEALVADGYQQVHDDRLEDAHPSLGPVTADPVTH